MASLFENAVASIRMGVEDFQQQDADRDISAVRNLYAGVLLLAKEALARRAPSVDPRNILSAAFKPAPDGNGGLIFEPIGQKTIDFESIDKRFRDFGLRIDRKALSELNAIRNDMEHHFSEAPQNAVKAAIAKAFPVISDLFRQIEEDPAEKLAGAWETMLEQKDLYDHERGAARESFVHMNWHADFLSGLPFKCSACGLDLLEQRVPENISQDAIEFRCRGCAAEPSRSAVIEAAVDEVYGTEAYIRVTEGAGEGPIYDCPACNRPALIDDEGVICANCGESLEFPRECEICNGPISVQDYLDGIDSGLCSYCNYKMRNAIRE